MFEYSWSHLGHVWKAVAPLCEGLEAVWEMAFCWLNEKKAPWNSKLLSDGREKAKMEQTVKLIQ